MDQRWNESARWTEQDVSARSFSNKEQIDFSVARAIRYLVDPERMKRLTQRLCVKCFYQGSSMAGQAMTRWNCRVCLKDQMMWPNTATPLACKSCADDHKICTDCGADLYLRVRRNNVKLLKDKDDSAGP